jgi:glycosyltransferase involved in cell wall biosynthesis
MSKDIKHWFLQPSIFDPFYKCGGWQIFNRMYELVGKVRNSEIITYRHREKGYRYLDDIPSDELFSGIVWIHWQSHYRELSERLHPDVRIVAYPMNTSYGRRFGEVIPDRWPLVCLSRYIAADYSIKDPWRHISYLGPALNPKAKNYHLPRDTDVLVHMRKNVPYVRNELVPALRTQVKIEVIDSFMPQNEFLARLNRCKVYLYWVHKQLLSIWIHEGFGMQPLEAIACGAFPVSNFYGGLSDYLEAPYNCYKIGVHSLEFDIKQIRKAVEDHKGANPEEERLGHLYGEKMFYERFFHVEENLLFYFAHCPGKPYQKFDIEPYKPSLYKRPYNWLYSQWRRTYKEIKGLRPR